VKRHNVRYTAQRHSCLADQKSVIDFNGVAAVDGTD